MAMASQPNAYDRKASLYARHRWDYPHPAIRQIIETAGVGPDSVVVDVGSGPGIVARHFVPIAKLVYAVEPGVEMRKIADDQLAAHRNFRAVRGSAEATTLPAASVDLITVGMAIQWFKPAPTIREFGRILRAGGLLAILRYSIAEEAVAEAIRDLLGGYPVAAKAPGAPPEAFLDVTTQKCFTYSTPRREDVERFVGAQLSAASAPEESSPDYHAFRDRAQSIFQRFAVDGLLSLTQTTELRIGRVRADAF